MFIFKLLFNWKVWLVIFAAAGYVVYRPEIMGNQQISDQIISLKEKYLNQKPGQLPTLSSITQNAQSAKDRVLGAYSQIQEKNVIPGLPREVVVNDAVNQLTEQIKQLPAEELKQVKRNFCRDVIDEATSSAGTHS
jgi:hypothetical protein